jgi:hypothetical protein
MKIFCSSVFSAQKFPRAAKCHAGNCVVKTCD